jgi:hypothetical protein
MPPHGRLAYPKRFLIVSEHSLIAFGGKEMLECRLNNPGIPKNTPYRPLVGMQYRSKRIIVPRWVVAQPEHINRSEAKPAFNTLYTGSIPGTESKSTSSLCKNGTTTVDFCPIDLFVLEASFASERPA